MLAGKSVGNWILDHVVCGYGDRKCVVSGAVFPRRLCEVLIDPKGPTRTDLKYQMSSQYSDPVEYTRRSLHK
jgi:hypothetical protein